LKRSEQRENTRAMILEAAAAEFVERGYAATVLSDISDRLGLTKGSVFFHFASKAELAARVVDSYFEQWQPLVEEALAVETGALNALEWLSYGVVEKYQNNVRVRAAVRLIREKALPADQTPTPYVDWLAVAESFLERARAAGEVMEDLDTENAAWQLIATFFGSQQIANDLDQREDLQKRLAGMWQLYRVAFGAAPYEHPQVR
jgi:AcrR family transcriptional regulator